MFSAINFLLNKKTLFKLKNTKTLWRDFYKSDFLNYFTFRLGTANSNNANIETNIPRDDSYISLESTATRNVPVHIYYVE